MVIKLDDSNNYSDIIYSFRKKQKLTQNQFAQLINVSTSTVATWEQKKNKPSYDVWRRIKKLIKNSTDLS